MERFSREAALAGGPGAGRRARAVVRDELDPRLPEWMVGDVALLVTELVANGVRHGGAGEDALLRLRLQGLPESLRVEVAQPTAAAGGVRPRAPDMDAGGGFGLNIVDRVASRWGVADGPATCVWFELDCL